MAAIQALVLSLVFVLNLTLVAGQVGRARCLPTTGTTDTNQIFKFSFKFARQTSTTITAISFFDGSTDPTSTSVPISSPAQCTDSTLDANQLYEVGFDIDGDTTLPCGISKSGNVYTFIIAVHDGSTFSAVKFTCTTGTGGNLNNFPTLLSIETFDTGNIVTKISHRSNTHALSYYLMKADSNKVPALTARLGESVKHQVVFDKEASLINRHSDNLGSSFTAVFLEHADADISLEISTPMKETIVRVSSTLGTGPFSRDYAVLRDESRIINLNDMYRQVSVTATGAWITSKRTIQVQVLIKDSVVGVKAISHKRTGSPRPIGEYTVLPDDALGKKYNCYTGAASGQVLVYAVEDSTTLTINFNSVVITSITINGAAVSATQTVSLSKNDVLYMACGTDCAAITLTSDKPMGVVTGTENGKLSTNTLNDHIVMQMPPVETYGTKFVISDLFNYQVILENPAGSITYTKGAAAAASVSSGTIITAASGADEVTFTGGNAMLLALTKDSGSTYRAFASPVPAVHQWAIRQFYFTTPGNYRFFVVARTGELTNIRLIDESGEKTFQSASLITFAAPVTGSSGFQFNNVVTYTVTKSSLLEFRSATNNKNFMVMVLPFDGTQYNRLSSLHGIGLPVVNPCTQSSASTDAIFGNQRITIPGDGEDNDCDGEVDEEMNDGQDNAVDTDTLIDDDLAVAGVSQYSGAWVKTLTIADNAAFANSGGNQAIELITNGCDNTAAKAGIRPGPFTWNKDIGHAFYNLHVVETVPFNAYYLNTPTVYYRVEVGFCVGNLTDSKCENSCTGTSTGRKRRDTGEEEIVTLETTLTVTGDDKEDELIKYDDSDECEMNKLYWIPAIMILLTILVESVVIATFTLHRSSLEKYV